MLVFHAPEQSTCLMSLFSLQEEEAVCSVPIVRGECLLKYHFRPQQEWQRSVGIFGCSFWGVLGESVLKVDGGLVSFAHSSWWPCWGSCQAVSCVPVPGSLRQGVGHGLECCFCPSLL